MDAGCECAPWVRSAYPSDSWALVYCVIVATDIIHAINDDDDDDDDDDLVLVANIFRGYSHILENGTLAH